MITEPIEPGHHGYVSARPGAVAVWTMWNDNVAHPGIKRPTTNVGLAGRSTWGPGGRAEGFGEGYHQLTQTLESPFSGLYRRRRPH